ncbi:MAG: Ig-like domain-containing protein [candidate division WOR-3 bacterium]
MRNYIVGVAALLVLLGLGSLCGPKDLEKPVVTMVTPCDLDTLAPGSIPIKAVATDDIRVTRVDFQVNGNLIASDSSGPADTFATVWNAAAETLGGVFTITAIAYDTRDSAASAWARVIIRATATPKVEIAGAADDGTYSVNRQLLPDSACGFIYGRNTTAAVGVYRVPDTMASRALYRFDVSSWTSGDIELHLRCREIQGASPGQVDLYVVPDFDTVPTVQAKTRLDSYWNLTAHGALADTLTPDTGWFALRVPANLAQQYRSATGYLGLLIRAHEEMALVDCHYVLDTYETTSPGMRRPYLTW